MNVLFALECETCNDLTNVRLGVSGRHEQPLRFSCKSCCSPIDIFVSDDHDMTFDGAHRVEEEVPFSPSINFVDLSLDFPVSFEPYQMGMTPFMRARFRIGGDSMDIHMARLGHLDTAAPYTKKFATLLKLYANQKVIPFKMNLDKTFGIKLKSDLPQDVNAGLYTLISGVMRAYEDPSKTIDDIVYYTKIISRIDTDSHDKMSEFVSSLISNGFLKNIQLDTLDIYPRMLSADTVMRPALFLDFDDEYASQPIAMRVSSRTFDEYKDLYKDISETLSRQLVLVAGINNLLHRSDFDSFTPRISAKGNSLHPDKLQTYADVAFGNKQDDLDDCWFTFLRGSTSNRLRNAIAHYKTEYDEVTQNVSYFPFKEGMYQVKSENMMFLDFLYGLLLSYREMHRLSHLIKALFYYNYLILKAP